MPKHDPPPASKAELKAAIAQECDYLGKLLDELERLKETAIHSLDLPQQGDALETVIGNGLDLMEEIKTITSSL